LGLTQEELSSRCGIAARSISCTECGKGNLTYFNLKRLSAGLQMSASELLACAEGIEETKMLDEAKLPAEDSPRKSAKASAEPRKTVRERRSERGESEAAAEKP
jgi:transcriptional regulator with XRE-family HTH domain